jgi:hypothetical protein
MLHLDDPALPLDRALLGAPGGFAWWYADALDERGDGLVTIAAWGLPFLPGDRAARRAGRAPCPADRPSLNLALYRGGRPVYYTLHQLPPDRATWTDTRWTFGDSELVSEDVGDERVLTARYDLPVPGHGERLRGELTVRGPRVRVEGVVADQAAHAWTPLAGPARCTARFDHGTTRLLELDATGYHDRNGSRSPLDALGLDRWTWGRQVVGDTLVVHYLNWPTDPDATPLHVVVTVGPDGRATIHRDVAIRLVAPRRTALGMPWWGRVEIDVDGEPLVVAYDPPVDSGPFYLRCTTRSTFRGRSAVGWAEVCRPERVDLARHRFLVNMCVDREAGPNSLWLPLFVGPRHDRVRRLLRRWGVP